MLLCIIILTFETKFTYLSIINYNVPINLFIIGSNLFNNSNQTNQNAQRNQIQKQNQKKTVWTDISRKSKTFFILNINY
jgi:GR25 family glycosyltransferase involved in LPS biosynthesis